MGMLKFRGDGNVYSGSAGCDPLLGNIENKTFRCRAWIEKREDNYILVAAYYYGLYSYEATDPSIITHKEFEASSVGISEAQMWLQEAEDNAINYFNNN